MIHDSYHSSRNSRINSKYPRSTCNHGPILELSNLFEKSGITASKAVVDIKYKNIVYKLPHELPNNLRLWEVINI